MLCVNPKEPELPPSRRDTEESQKEVKNLSRTRQAALGKEKHWGREKMKKQESVIFSPLRQNSCLVSVNTILKCIKAWRKLICYGLQLNRKHFLLYEGDYWFTGGLSILTCTLCHRYTHPILRADECDHKRCVVTSFGKTEGEKWFLLHEQTIDFNSCLVPPGPSESIRLIISLCHSHGLRSPCSALSRRPLFSLFLHYIFISFLISFRSPTH